MGIRRFAKFSRNARIFACVGNRLSSPKARHCNDRTWSLPRADDPDRPRLLHDDPIALNISAPHRVAARLVVGPDDVWDVGVGNERYNAVAPSGSGVGSEVDGGHSKSSPGPRLRLRASLPGPPSETESPYVAHSARQRLTEPSDQPTRLKGDEPREFDDRRHRSSGR